MTTQTIPDSLACEQCEDDSNARLSPADAVAYEQATSALCM